jgi:hypothetical protein
MKKSACFYLSRASWQAAQQQQNLSSSDAAQQSEATTGF